MTMQPKDPGAWFVFLCLHETMRKKAGPLVLCQSADGWSLHAPESTDEQIASGDAPYLLSGPGEPTAEDYKRACAIFQIKRGNPEGEQHD